MKPGITIKPSQLNFHSYSAYGDSVGSSFPELSNLSEPSYQVFVFSGSKQTIGLLAINLLPEKIAFFLLVHLSLITPAASVYSNVIRSEVLIIT